MLLLDENLSPKLTAKLDGDFPGIKHVLHVGLDNENDSRIWKYAKSKGYAIVTKDKDYLVFIGQYGPPPKVIFLTIGNCRSAMLEIHIKTNRGKICAFLDDRDNGLLEL